MTIEYYIDLIRFADLMILALIIMLFIKNWHRDQNVKIGVFYLLSIMCYLLISWKLVNESIYFYIVISGAFSVPILFWFFSRSVFDDGFKINISHFWIFLITVIFYYVLFYYNYVLDGKNAGFWYSNVINGTPQAISIIFIVLGIGEAYKNSAIDLLESRIRFRKAFIFATGIIIILTLIVEIAVHDKAAEIYLSLLQKSAIGIILFIFFYFLVEFKPGFFFEKQKVKETSFEADPKISAALSELIKAEKIYLQEGLTIRKLAELMNEQEYKIRRYINQHLGFRNFNDFLNSYRIQDACEILLDEKKSDLTVLEIAYSLGYSSLGPFNKAFKNHTGTTPTAFRKGID